MQSQIDEKDAEIRKLQRELDNQATTQIELPKSQAFSAPPPPPQSCQCTRLTHVWSTPTVMLFHIVEQHPHRDFMWSLCLLVSSLNLLRILTRHCIRPTHNSTCLTTLNNITNPCRPLSGLPSCPAQYDLLFTNSLNNNCPIRGLSQSHEHKRCPLDLNLLPSIPTQLLMLNSCKHKPLYLHVCHCPHPNPTLILILP